MQDYMFKEEKKCGLHYVDSDTVEQLLGFYK